MEMWVKRSGMLLAAALVLAGCEGRKGAGDPSGGSAATREGSAAENQVVRVVVTNYPLEYFAQRIGGDAVKVEFPMAGDGDPMEWTPTKDSVQKLQTADLVLTNGATYEKWLPQVTLREEAMVDTSANFQDQYIQVEEAVTHSHGPEGEHSHAGTAFTTWIDFKLASQQAAAIAGAFIESQPTRREDFESNLAKLQEDLQALDEDMQAAAKVIGDHPLVVSHPVYQYWARAYGLNTKAVHWEPDAMPDEAAVNELKELLRTHPAKVMIWEDQPTAEIAEVVRGLGLQVVVFNPCGNRPSEGDWLTAMRTNIANLQAVEPAASNRP